MADKPNQRVEYGGQVHEFPADFTSQDISSALKSWDATQGQPPPTQDAGPGAAIGRVFNNIVSAPGQMIGAFTDPATKEEIAHAGQVPPRIGLGLRRLLIEPSERLRQSADEPGLDPQVANLRRFSSNIPVPVLAPLAESIVERAHFGAGQTPKPDPSGAITELASYLALPKATQLAGKVVGKVVGEPTRTAARGLMNVGTGQTKTALADVLKKNVESETSAAADTAKNQAWAARKTAENQAAAATATAQNKAAADAANTARLQAHQQKLATIQESNRLAQETYQKAVNQQGEIQQAAKETETQRGQLARQIQQQGVRMLNRIQAVREATKGKLDTQFEKVRSAVGGATVPRDTLAQDVSEAQQKLQGSNESLKVFNDILKKAPEDEGDVAGSLKSGAETAVTKKHALYDSLEKGGVVTPEPPPDATFNDLQGYVSELGEKLSTGTLPGDVYQAMKFLQDRILDRMEGMAAQADVRGPFRMARAGWKAYRQAFYDAAGPTSSALAKALRERLPEKAIPHLSTAEDVRDIRTKLAQFDPGVMGAGGSAQLYDNYMNALRDYEGLPKASSAKPVSVPTLKPEPDAPRPIVPKVVQGKAVTPKVVEPEISKMGTDELQQTKRDVLQRKAEEFRSTGKYDVRLLAVGLMEPLLGKLTLLGPLAVLSEKAAGVALENPRLVEWMTRPSATDIELLQQAPPAYQGVIRENLHKLSDSARAKGIPVSPKWSTVMAGIGSQPSPQPEQQ